MTFEIHGAVDTLAVILVFRFVDDGGTGVARPAEVCVHIVHAALNLTVNAGKVLGTHVAGLLPERREEEDTVA